MRVLLINPIITDTPSALEFPLNLVFLTSSLVQSLSDIKVVPLDLTLEVLAQEHRRVDIPRIQEKIVEQVWERSQGFDLVGISGLCDNFHLTIRLARFIKRKFGVKVLVGGPQATFLPTELLSKFRFIDFVIRNDGVGPLAALCTALAKGCPLSGVPALTYRDGKGTILHNPADKDGDGINEVQPDYSVLPLEKYIGIRPDLSIPVLAGTGCPFSCTYCTTSKMWHRRYRLSDPDKLAELITSLKKRFPYSKFSLIHDNLLFDAARVEKLCNCLSGTGVVWSCSSRLEHIAGKEELLRRLRDSGCRSVFIGVETASERMQRVIGKNLNVSRVESVAKEMISAGVKPVFSFIIGFPEESDADRDATIKLAFRLKAMGAERVTIGHLFPLPGTVYSGMQLEFLRDRRGLLSPELLVSRSALHMVATDSEVFCSLWHVKHESAKTRLLPSATKRLSLFCATHYYAFDRVFSGIGIPPSRIFRALEGRGRGLLDKISSLLPQSEARGFKDMFRYESLRKSLSKLAEEPLSDNRAANAEIDFASIYRLSNRGSLFSFGAGSAVWFSSLAGKAVAPGGRAYLCLVAGNKKVETYALKPEFYGLLRRLRANKNSSLESLFAEHFQGAAPDYVVPALAKLLASGALINADEN